MIFHSLRLANWRKLTAVEVPNFSPRITIIYAPNKTGKSSLFEAIRWALVDYDYGTTRIDRIIPWNTNHVPEVAVDFEVNGQKHRLVKRFTKKKEGGAELYQLSNGGNPKLVERDKEVTTRVRQLLGVGKSGLGIAQLLWVNQGEVGLPAIDPDLDKCLRPVLGTVITGRDRNFREKLRTKMREWFTSEMNAATGKHKPTSSLREMEQRIDERQREVNEINSTFQRIDALLSDVDQKQQAIVIAEADVSTAKNEVETLQQADRDLTARRERAKELERLLGDRRKELSGLQGALEKHQENRDTMEKALQRLQGKKEECTPLHETIEAARKALDAVTQKREQVEKEMQKLDDRRTELDAMRRLLQIQEDAQKAESTLESATRKEEQIQSAEEKLARLSAPEKKHINQIRHLLDRLVELDAELKAAQLSLTITPNRVGSVTLQIDRGDNQRVVLTPGQTVARSVRQRIQLAIEGFGTIEVARGEEDAKIEDLASEYGRREQELSRLLAPWGVGELERAEVIPELTQRATQREGLQKRLEEYRKEFTDLAPKGIAELKAVIENGKKKRSNLLQAHPKLKSWKPSRASIEQTSDDLGRAEKNQKEARRTARENEDQANADLKNYEQREKVIEREINDLNIEFVRKETSYKNHEHEYGSEADLVNAIGAKQEEVTNAQNDFGRHRLTENEERVPKQLEAARQALDTREKRLQDLGGALRELTGQLKSYEELHARRVAAEQGLDSAKREHKRIEVEVDAHRMLLKHFDKIRDEQLGKSIAPVKELVDRWLYELDGVGHPKVTFDDLRVDKLTVLDGSSLDVEEATSYGEREQLGTLVRLAYGAVLAGDERQVVILDDPFAHADTFRHRKMLQIIEEAAEKNLQIIILTCHPNRFDHIKDATMFDLEGHLEPVKG